MQHMACVRDAIVFPLFVWTGENDSNTLRADKKIFVLKNIRILVYKIGKKWQKKT